MNNHEPSRMRLYSPQGERLYLNAGERKDFEVTANLQAVSVRLFCLLLHYTGCRPSEARNLTTFDVQVAEAIISINCLKKRNKHLVRELPVPQTFAQELENYITHSNITGRLWPIGRTTAWSWINQVMTEADIQGAQASAKGIRHGFGVCASMNNIAPAVIQRWLGHTHIQTTMIYTQIIGKEERELAERMW